MSNRDDAIREEVNPQESTRHYDPETERGPGASYLERDPYLPPLEFEVEVEAPREEELRPAEDIHATLDDSVESLIYGFWTEPDKMYA